MTEQEDPSRDRLKQHFAQRVIHQARQLLEVWQRLQRGEWNDAGMQELQEAAQLLQAPWPGNVRQLINVAERAVLQNRRGSGSIASLLMADGEDSHTADATTTEGKPLKEYVESFEKMLLDNTMRRHKGAISAVMDELCLPRRTLNEKMAKYGLSRSDYL